MYYLGFDIGGSSVKAGLIKNKKIVKFEIKDLPDNLSGLLDLLVQIKDDFQKEVGPEEIKGIGFGIAGIMDGTRETMLNSPNIKYLNGQPIKQLIENKMSPYPVKIEHDVHCFLLAERELGIAKNFKNVFFLTFGTGIGGAWMADGKIIIGSHGSAGEIGHAIFNFKSEEDFEDLASNRFVIKMLGMASDEAFKKATAGDRQAQKVFLELGKNIGVGIANIINIFDPEAVILAGGIAAAKDFIWPGIKEIVEKFVASPAAKNTQILFSEFGREGGVLGAALALDTDF